VIFLAGIQDLGPRHYRFLPNFASLTFHGNTGHIPSDAAAACGDP
jgi:hypothetical protein